MKKNLLLIVLVALSLATKAQQIQQYNFTGAAGNETTFPSDGQPENGILSEIKRGSGVSPSPGGGSFSGVNFTLDSQIDTSDYYDFGIAANPTFFLSLDSIVLGERRSNTGIRKFSVRSSQDNFASDLQVFDVPDSANFRYSQKVTLGDSFKNIAGGTSIHFRYFGYQAESSAGTWRMDSIRVYGQITASPLASQPFKTLNKFKISPNPGSDLLQLEGQTPVEESVYIYSSNGQVMTDRKSGLTSWEIDTKAWPAGLYFIRSGNQNQRWIKK